MILDTEFLSSEAGYFTKRPAFGQEQLTHSKGEQKIDQKQDILTHKSWPGFRIAFRVSGINILEGNLQVKTYNVWFRND